MLEGAYQQTDSEKYQVTMATLYTSVNRIVNVIDTSQLVAKKLMNEPVIVKHE